MSPWVEAILRVLLAVALGAGIGLQVGKSLASDLRRCQQLGFDSTEIDIIIITKLITNTHFRVQDLNSSIAMITEVCCDRFYSWCRIIHHCFLLDCSSTCH